MVDNGRLSVILTKNQPGTVSHPGTISDSEHLKVFRLDGRPPSICLGKVLRYPPCIES